jgi:MATE family multidrug resistance protein
MVNGGYLKQFKTTFLLAYPVMLSQLGQIMVGVSDSVMVGQLGTAPLAGVSLGNSIFVLFLTFGIGISYGITPLVAKADGEKNPRTIIDILKHGFLVNCSTGCFLFLSLYFTAFLFPYLNQPAEVIVLAKPYFIVISFSIIPFMIFQVFRQFSEGLSLTRQAMMITISGNILNIILNYLFIFGKLGIPAYGMLGAGIATLIARTYMALAMIVFVLYGKYFTQYWAYFNKRGLDMRLVRNILNIGLPSGLQFIFEVGAFSLAAIMIGWLGASSLAAHQIAINLAAITYMMATGLAAATTIRVGNQLGKRDFRSMREVGFTGFIMSGTFMSINALILIIGRYYFPTLYIHEAEVIGIASDLLLIAALFQLSDGIQVVGLGALRGMADVRIPTLVTLIAYWVLALPVGYFLGFTFNLGASGIWIGLLTGLTITAVVLLYRFHKLCKLKINLYHSADH